MSNEKEIKMKGTGFQNHPMTEALLRFFLKAIADKIILVTLNDESFLEVLSIKGDLYSRVLPPEINNPLIADVVYEIREAFGIPLP